MAKKKAKKRTKKAARKGSASKSKASGHRWKPGQSGNPKGRPPNEEIRRVRDLASKHVPEAIQTLASVMSTSDDDRARCLAANSILDRAAGKPKQQHEFQVQDLRRMSDNELLAKVAEALEVIPDE